MATVKLYHDVKDGAWLAANLDKVLDDDEPLFLTDGRYTHGDGVTPLSGLTLFPQGSTLESELLSGGEITTGTYGGSGTNDDIRVAAATWYVENNGSYSTSVDTDFLDIALSTTGNQRYVGLYGTTSNTITKVEGTEGLLATEPSQPADTAVIGFVLVTDTALDISELLDGYVLKSAKATPANTYAGTNDEQYLTPYGLNQSGLIARDLASIRYSGKYYTFMYSAISSSSGWTVGYRLMPIIVGPAHSIDALRFHIGTGVSSTNCRVGLYDSHPTTGYPTTLLEDSGNISTAASGDKVYLLPTSRFLTSKLVYAALFIGASGLTIPFASAGNVILERTSGLTVLSNAYFVAAAFGAFPANFPSSQSPVTNTSLMLVELRKV